jgi:sodium transport system ATP-binding protein
MQEVQRLCDHVVVMARGRAVAAGSVEQLCRLSGHDDFEQAFVTLPFADAEGDVR